MGGCGGSFYSRDCGRCRSFRLRFSQVQAYGSTPEARASERAGLGEAALDALAAEMTDADRDLREANVRSRIPLSGPPRIQFSVHPVHHSRF